MLKTRVIPCLTINDSGLVKTVRFKNPSYVGDPINAIKIFNDKEVDELVLLDISASRIGKGPNFRLISEIASECFMPLGYGGGITSLKEIESLFKLGIEKVILNTIAYKNPDIVKEAIQIFGSQSIVVSVDVKKQWLGSKQIVYVLSGSENTKYSPLAYAKKMEELGAGELILNSIDQDGMMNGYDVSLIHSVSNSVSIPVVALGGAGSLNDFKKAKEAGASALAAGSFFIFQKPHRAVLITYPNREQIEFISN